MASQCVVESPRPGGDEVRDDDIKCVVASGEEEENDGGQGIEERQPVEDEEGGWSVLFRD